MIFTFHAKMRLLERYQIPLDRQRPVFEFLESQIRSKQPIEWYPDLRNNCQVYECSTLSGRKIYPMVKGRVIVTILDDNKQKIIESRKAYIKSLKEKKRTVLGLAQGEDVYVAETSIPYDGISRFEVRANSKKEAIRKLGKEHPYAYFKSGCKITRQY